MNLIEHVPEKKQKSSSAINLGCAIKLNEVLRPAAYTFYFMALAEWANFLSPAKSINQDAIALKIPLAAQDGAS